MSGLAVSRRRFAPSPAITLATLIACLLFVRLGFWQWQRGEQRQQRWAHFARGSEPLALDRQPPDSLPPFQRVTVAGRLDGAHQFLLDNRTYQGRAGYEVLTPLVREGGGVLLIDRGWVPFSGSRARLPDVHLELAAAVTLTGRLSELPHPGLASGRAAPAASAPWPKVTSYPSAAQLGAALGERLPEQLLLLDPQQPYGYLRDWRPPGLSPWRNFSYAIQWWSFAVFTLILWALMSRRGARATPAP